MKLGLIELLIIIAAYVAWVVIRPVWTEFLFFSSMTPYWLRQWATERFGAAIGCCRHCGYNLKANQSGICPECGNPADPVAPLREVERPPKLWSRWLIVAGAGAVVFTAIVLTIILW